MAIVNENCRVAHKLPEREFMLFQCLQVTLLTLANVKMSTVFNVCDRLLTGVHALIQLYQN